MIKTMESPSPSISGPAAQAEETRAAHFIARDDFDRDVWCLLGLPVDAADIDRAVAEIDAAVSRNKKLSFVTPNVNWLVKALKDPAARQRILNADLSVADGAPLVAMAKLLGLPIQTRVAGSDIFEALRRRPSFGGRRLKVFFFGGRDGAAEAAAKALNEEQGGLEAVGWHNPGFGGVEDMSAAAIIEKINAAKPDFVVVALGAEKGQAWIERNKDLLDAPVTAHLGAVVDFTAGGVERAPSFFQKAGLEWAWRIKEEPGLWRRYFSDGVSLAGLTFTRLLPQWMRMSAGASDGEAKAERIVHGDRIQLKLSGVITKPTLAPIRETFRQAAASGLNVELDLSQIEHFDRSFLGLVLMLEKHVASADGILYLGDATSAQRAVLRANAMVYPEPSATAGRAAAVAAARS